MSNTSPLHHLYCTARWKAVRSEQLGREPLCRMCLHLDPPQMTEATICDHITPHKGDVGLFWSGPFQSLCKQHHDGAKRQQEMSGVLRGCDARGYPLGREW